MFVTASSMNSYTACPRKYQYSYIDQRRLAKPSPALLVGSAVHLGLEFFWKGQDKDAALGAVKQFMREEPYFETEAGRIEQMRVNAYVLGYYAHRSGYRKMFDVVAVEEEFCFQAEGIEFRGKIDLILRGKKDGDIYVVDHKTSGDREVDDLTSSFWRKLTYDTQMVLYGMATNEIIKEEAQTVLVYDVIKKTKSKPCQKKKISKRKAETTLQFEVRKHNNQETESDYWNRVWSEYTSSSSRYMWEHIHIGLDQLGEKIEEVMHVAKQMSEPGMVYPRNQNACISRWGRCDYFNVCTGTERLSSPNYIDKPAHVELNQGKENGLKI